CTAAGVRTVSRHFPRSPSWFFAAAGKNGFFWRFCGKSCEWQSAAKSKIEKARARRQIHAMTKSVFKRSVYLVGDNIDTDQIIPAQYLNLIPTIPDEYEKLGSFAMCGLPDALYPTRFVKAGAVDADYPIVVAGRNFGCGSSREHAPIALGS